MNTYVIIPISDKVNLVEWVNQTQTIQAVIETIRNLRL